MKIPERLKNARKRTKLTLQQVKKKFGIGISSLSEFESGKREPRLSQLQALASAYRLPLSYFISDEPPRHEMVLWREQPAEEHREIEARFLQLCEQYHNLELWCDARIQSCLPDAQGEKESFSYDDAEALAIKVRSDLQLGNRPGQELLRVLEEVCGVKIFHISFDPTGAAASIKSEIFGHAVLLNSSNVRWRRNFDLAHELFHLLTWDIFRAGEDSSTCVAEDKEEKRATCFASHLLMPTDVIKTALTRVKKDNKYPYKDLIDVARQFDVSIEALLWRMHFLFRRKPDDQEKTKADIERAKEISRLHDRQRDTKPPTWPARYQSLAITALQLGEISIGRFAQYLEISRQDAMTYLEDDLGHDEEVQYTDS